MSSILPLVSVTMPVYNGERTIQLSINSLLYQTYPNWICIIVNDCSTDGTGEILKKYESDPRFKIIHLPENKGRGNARQVALDNAEGDYLAFLDADDLYHPEKLENQVKAFSEFPSIVVTSTGVGSFDTSLRLRTKRGFKYKGLNHYKGEFRFPGIPASVMILLDLAQKNSYSPHLRAAEDNDFLHKCLSPNLPFYVIEDILYYYEEFGVISRSKFVFYQWNAFKKSLSISRSFIGKFQLLITGYIKFLVFYFLALLFGVDFIVNKRGVRVSIMDRIRFQMVINVIK
jgi:glycosyltransferase involved in cell wall biosynthesis